MNKKTNFALIIVFVEVTRAQFIYNLSANMGVSLCKSLLVFAKFAWVARQWLG